MSNNIEHRACFDLKPPVSLRRPKIWRDDKGHWNIHWNLCELYNNPFDTSDENAGKLKYICSTENNEHEIGGYTGPSNHNVVDRGIRSGKTWEKLLKKAEAELTYIDIGGTKSGEAKVCMPRHHSDEPTIADIKRKIKVDWKEYFLLQPMSFIEWIKFVDSPRKIQQGLNDLLLATILNKKQP